MKIFRAYKEELEKKKQQKLEDTKEYQEQMKLIQDKLELDKISIDEDNSDNEELMNFEIGSNNSGKVKRRSSVKINEDSSVKKNLVSNYTVK